MTEIESVKKELAEIELQLIPLQERSAHLRRRLVQLESVQFITFNQIKRNDVEMVDGPNKPYFTEIKSFINWIRTQANPKPWTEWNGRIHHTADLLSSKMRDMPGFTSDLKD